jgi:hypothetical protein
MFSSKHNDALQNKKKEKRLPTMRVASLAVLPTAMILLGLP